MNKIKNILLYIMIALLLMPIKVSADDLSCQFAVNLDVPSNFDIPCYAVFYNTDTEEEFTVHLIPENDYRGRISVSPGTYLVAQISAADDITCKYPFELPSDPITLTEKNNYTVNSRLLNYEEVSDAINNYIETGEIVEIEDTFVIEETEIEEVIIEDIVEEEKEPPILLIIIIVVLILAFIGFIIYCAFFKS